MTIYPPPASLQGQVQVPRSAYVQTRMQGITDLTVLATIKTGFVEGAIETVTYVDRLRRLLQALDAARHSTREAALQPSPFSDLVGRLNIVHFFRFAIVPPDPNDRDGRYRMLLNVTFDGGWEAYMRVIWRDLGSLLDAICCNCDDYPLAHAHSFDEYITWVREHEIPAAFFYTDSGDSLGDHHYREYLEKVLLTTRDPELADYFAAVFRLDTAQQSLAKSIAHARRSPTATITNGLKALLIFFAQLRAYSSAPGGDAQVLQRFVQDLLQELLVLVREHVFERKEFAKLGASYAEPLQWFAAPVKRWTPPPERLTLKRRDMLAKIQGGILDPYVDVSHGCCVLLRVRAGKAKEALEFLSRWPVTAGDNKPLDGLYRNIAFTYRGLRALSIAPAHLDMLPFEFKEGMDARAGMLGDVRVNHPDHWREPVRNWPMNEPSTEQIEIATVHVIVQLRALHDDDGHDLIDPFKAEIARLEEHGLTALCVQPMRRFATQGGRPIGHFGFVDGISQPEIEERKESAVASRLGWSDVVKPGEILLGYANNRGDGPCPAEANPLLDYGSFLVVRKLRQRLDILNAVLAEQALKITGNADAAATFSIELQEKMMGRRKNGDSLGSPARPGNDFNFKDDPLGAQCPFHSHVRRLNPRLLDRESPPQPSLLPRILRRGMSYGPRPDGANDTADRGIMFMAYNASISEQFEVLQRWVSGSSAAGFSAAESDPFLGIASAGTSRTFRFLHNGKPLRVELGDRPFVELAWGVYSFTPSLYALKHLKSFTAGAETSRDISQRVSSVTSSDSFTQWQQRLEDPDKLVSAWQQVRSAPGCVTDTAYGVLVGGMEEVANVLRDDGSTHSVCGYGERLSKSIGNGYLGQDPHHGQDPHTAAVNLALADITAPAAYARSAETTNAILQTLLHMQQEQTGKREIDLSLPRLVDDVLAALCTKWFGLPDEVFIKKGSAGEAIEPARYTGHSFSVAQYVFWPSPSRETTTLGQEQGIALARAALAYIRSKPVLKDLAAKIDAAVRATHGTDEDVARTLIGVMQGLPPTVTLTLLGTLRKWVSTKLLWDLQLELPRRPLLKIGYAEASAALSPSLLASMRASPVPPMLWRTALKRCTVGAVDVAAGKRVIVGLGSAIADSETHTPEQMLERDDLVFGGKYATATHGCPGRDMAMGIMIGLLSALLKAGTLRATPHPLALVLRG